MRLSTSHAGWPTSQALHEVTHGQKDTYAKPCSTIVMPEYKELCVCLRVCMCACVCMCVCVKNMSCFGTAGRVHRTHTTTRHSKEHVHAQGHMYVDV